MLKKERPWTKKIVWIRSANIDLFLDQAAEMEMLKHLAEFGNHICLFAGQSRKQLSMVEPLKARPNIHFILIPFRYVSMLSTFLFGFLVSIFLPFLVLTEKPDFAIVQPGPPVASFLWKPLLSVSKCRLIMDIRSTPTSSLGVPAKRQSILYRLQVFADHLLFNISVLMAKRVSNGITTLTEGMKREICSRFHVNPEFVGVWTMGVSTTLFDPDNHDGQEMRKRHGLNGKFIVFHHGVFGFQRGILESIKSIEMLRRENNNIVFFLLGTGPALSALKELVQEDGMQHEVIIHNPVDYLDVPKYIAMCDVGIVPLPDLPEWKHQCPQKLLEYLAMKKVAIVTDIPAHREIIRKSRCGIYVSSADPGEIANAIAYAYENRDRLYEWGLSGRVVIDERYSWDKVAEELENFLHKHAS